MGLNDNVCKVNQAINEQTEAIKKDNAYKQYFNDLKTQFSEILQAELIEAISQDKNVFDNEYKIFIINNVVEDFQKYSCGDNIEVLKRFLKYKVDLKSFLFQKYYSIANQCRMMHKKSIEHEKQQNNDIDYKQKIAIEKWDLQRQKELLKIKQLEQKIAQNEQKYNIKQPQQRTATKNNIKDKRKRWRSCKSIVIYNACTCCNIWAYNIRVYKCSSKNKVKMEGLEMNKIIKMIFVLIIIFISLYIQKQQIIKNIKVENIEDNRVTLEIDNNYYIYE